MTADHFRAGPAHEGFRIDAGLCRFRHKLGGQLAYVNVAGTEIQGRHGFEDGVALELRQFVSFNLTHVAVRLHDAGNALVIEGPSVTVSHHIATVELTDNGNHGFRERLPLLPIGERIIKAR